MRRIVETMLLVCLLGFAGEAAAGTIEDSKIAAVDKAAAAFAALGKDSYQVGKSAPREFDPAVKPLIDAVYDTSGLGALSPIAFSDIDKLNDWSLKVVEVGSVYVFAGTGVLRPIPGPARGCRSEKAAAAEHGRLQPGDGPLSRFLATGDAGADYFGHGRDGRQAIRIQKPRGSAGPCPDSREASSRRWAAW